MCRSRRELSNEFLVLAKFTRKIWLRYSRSGLRRRRRERALYLPALCVQIPPQKEEKKIPQVTLQELTGMIFAAEKEELELELVGGMNESHFDSMQAFTTELATACGIPATGKDGKISRFEFLCFTLVKNDVVEMENIEIAMKNFNELDADGSG